MNLIRLVARPMMSALFVTEGLEAVRHPEAKVERAKPYLDRLRGVLSFLPDDDVLLIRVNGAVQVAAGALFATGRFPRVAAVALAGTLVNTTLAGHAFWNVEDPVEKRRQRVQFEKNLALLGGMIIASFDREGRPSLTWRAGRAAERIAHSTAETARSAVHALPGVD